MYEFKSSLALFDGRECWCILGFNITLEGRSMERKGCGKERGQNKDESQRRGIHLTEFANISGFWLASNLNIPQEFRMECIWIPNSLLMRLHDLWCAQTLDDCVFERDYFSMNLDFACYENGIRGFNIYWKSHEAILTWIEFYRLKKSTC